MSQSHSLRTKIDTKVCMPLHRWAARALTNSRASGPNAEIRRFPGLF